MVSNIFRFRSQKFQARDVIRSRLDLAICDLGMRSKVSQYRVEDLRLRSYSSRVLILLLQVGFHPAVSMLKSRFEAKGSLESIRRVLSRIWVWVCLVGQENRFKG